MKLKDTTISSLVFYLLVFLLGVQFLVSLTNWLIQLNSPIDLDYVDLWQAYIAQQAYPAGEHLGSARLMPYSIVSYPPFSYLVFSAISKILSITDLVGIRTLGRAITIGNTLLDALLIFLISRKLQVNLVWSSIAALCFLTSFYANIFAVSLRPDAMVLGFSLLILYILQFQKPNYWLIGVAFGLILTTKHSYIAAPVVVLFSLLWQRDFRSLLKMLGSTLAVFGIVALLSNLLIGPYWWECYTLQVLRSILFKQAIFFVGQGFQQLPLIFGLVTVFTLGFQPPLKIISSSFVLTLVLNSIALSKIGAASNYLLEPVAFGSILSAYLVHRSIQKNSDLFTKNFAVALLLALIIPSTVMYIDMTAKNWRNLRHVSASEIALIEMLKTVPGDILSNVPGKYFTTGHKPYNVPSDFTMVAIDDKRIDGTAMEKYIEEHHFGAIVTDPLWKTMRRFPLSWIAAIEKNYEVVENSLEKYAYLVMKPKT